MKLRISSVPLMLKYISKQKEAVTDTELLKKIFSHPDYRYEMRRYGIANEEQLISYFSNMKTMEQENIPDFSPSRPNVLRDRHSLWQQCLDNPMKYHERMEQVKQVLCEDAMKDLPRRVRSFFTKEVNLDDVEVVVTLGLGPSFGYFYENALHLDLFRIEEMCSFEELPIIILHEMHHIYVERLVGSYQEFFKDFSLLEKYIFRFSGEGLAIKFCNNAEGILSKPINPNIPSNSGLTGMECLNKHFEENFTLFCDTIKKINAGLMTENEMEEQFVNYWQNPFVYGSEAPLGQTPVYSFGNEIYGCIYDTFGLEVVFECFYHPARVIYYFNKTGCGYVMPEEGESSQRMC